MCVCAGKINIKTILESHLTMTGKVHIQYHRHQVHRHLCHKHFYCKHFHHITNWLQGSCAIKEKMNNETGRLKRT